MRSETVFDHDGRRWTRYEPLTRYVIKFTVPQDKDPYVAFLEDKVKRLEKAMITERRHPTVITS